MTKTKDETMLDAEVTITFVLDDVCFESDLIDENHFAELVNEILESGEYTIEDFEIKKISKIS